jgi:hypothetical protein
MRLYQRVRMQTRYAFEGVDVLRVGAEELGVGVEKRDEMVAGRWGEVSRVEFAGQSVEGRWVDSINIFLL